MDNKIGQLIRTLRKENKDRLEDLGNKLGYSYGGLAKIERGEVKPSIDLLKKIANIYDRPVSYFIGTEQELPNELKDIDVEWISFINDMKERDITPEEVKQILDFMSKYNQ